MEPIKEKYHVYLRRDPVTNIVVEEGWYAGDDIVKGQYHPPFHRVDGPAAIHRDARTGVVIQEEWLRHGKRHREDGPAITYRTAEGKTTYSSWYKNDELIPYRDRPKARRPRGVDRPHN